MSVEQRRRIAWTMSGALLASLVFCAFAPAQNEASDVQAVPKSRQTQGKRVIIESRALRILPAARKRLDFRRRTACNEPRLRLLGDIETSVLVKAAIKAEPRATLGFPPTSVRLGSAMDKPVTGQRPRFYPPRDPAREGGAREPTKQLELRFTPRVSANGETFNVSVRATAKASTEKDATKQKDEAPHSRPAVEMTSVALQVRGLPVDEVGLVRLPFEAAPFLPGRGAMAKDGRERPLWLLLKIRMGSNQSDRP